MQCCSGCLCQIQDKHPVLPWVRLWLCFPTAVVGMEEKMLSLSEQVMEKARNDSKFLPPALAPCSPGDDPGRTAAPALSRMSAGTCCIFPRCWCAVVVPCVHVVKAQSRKWPLAGPHGVCAAAPAVGSLLPPHFLGSAPCSLLAAPCSHLQVLSSQRLLQEYL